MDGLKGIAEVLEHILYEFLGLIVPGAALVLVIAGIVGDPWWTMLLTFVDKHPWLSLGGAYVLGYPVQGVSRPVTTIFGWLLPLPWRLLFMLIGLLSKRFHQWLQTRLDMLRRKLTGRHAHDRLVNSDDVDLVELGTAYWATRLGVPTGKRLSRRQVQDLSFSAILPERKQLDRFRAATSLTRGVAVAVVAAFSLLVYQLVVGVRGPSTLLIIALIGLALAFYGLMERADMYDGLWRTVVPAQFLCAVTRNPASAGETDSAAPAPHTSKEHRNG